MGTRETDLQYVMLLTVHLLHLGEECSPGEPSVLCSGDAQLHCCMASVGRGGSHVCGAEGKRMEFIPKRSAKGETDLR